MEFTSKSLNEFSINVIVYELKFCANFNSVTASGSGNSTMLLAILFSLVLVLVVVLEVII